MSAPYRSDRARVEIALIPSCFFRIASAPQLVEDDSSNAEFIIELRRTFAEAVTDVFADLPAARASKLLDRVYRVREAMLAEFEDRPIATALVAVTTWARTLNEAGIVPLHEGPFMDAIASFFAAVEEKEVNLQTVEDVTRSATKAARRMHQDLRRRGYYADFPDPFATVQQKDAA